MTFLAVGACRDDENGCCTQTFVVAHNNENGCCTQQRKWLLHTNFNKCADVERMFSDLSHKIFGQVSGYCKLSIAVT